MGRTFWVRNIQGGLSINNCSCQEEAKDGTASLPHEGHFQGAEVTGGRKQSPGTLPSPQWGVSLPLLRASPLGHRSCAQAADTNSVSPQEPRQSQIMIVPFNTWPMSVLCLQVINVGFVAHKLKAPIHTWHPYESSNMMTP